MAGHWVYIDIPSKTSRYTLYCEVADRPRFKNRTVHRYKPVSQSAFNACQNYPIQPWQTVRSPGADRPQLCVPHHQRRTSSLEQFKKALRTVRSLWAEETTMSLVQTVKYTADRPRPWCGPSAAHIISPTSENTLSGTF